MPLEVASAGTHALPGYAAASIAQTTISEIGLSLEHHRSQPASADLIARATLVVAMTDTQRDMLQTAFPNDKDKIVSFNDVTGLGDVLDPVGGDAAQVRAVRDLLQRGMPAVFETFEKYVHTSR
jgi:protein-tyrosine-phosphatase